MQLHTTREPTESRAGAATVTAQYLTGPFGSALRSLGTCDIIPGSDFGEVAPVLGGVAYRQCDGKLRIVLPGEPDRIAGNDVHGVRSAGNFVAWIDGPYNFAGAQPVGIVVYDVRAGQVAYRLPPAAVPSRLGSFTLQSDGKVAFSFDPNPADQSLRAAVAWASPSEPRVHQLQLPERRFYVCCASPGTAWSTPAMLAGADRRTASSSASPISRATGARWCATGSWASTSTGGGWRSRGRRAASSASSFGSCARFDLLAAAGADPARL